MSYLIFFSDQQIQLNKQKQSAQQMNKARLVDILFESSPQGLNIKKSLRSSNTPAQLNDMTMDFPVTARSNRSNKVIKITQFNNQISVNDNRLVQQQSGHNQCIFPIKSKNIKRITELKNKAVQSAQKIIEAEIKKRDKIKTPQLHKNLINEQLIHNTSIDNILMSTQCHIKRDQPNVDVFSVNNKFADQSNPFKMRQKQKLINQMLYEQSIYFCQTKQIIKENKEKIRITSSRDKSKKIINLDGVWNKTENQSETRCNRSASPSPKKYYLKHINEQKKYQENVEKERREILQLKRQLNKNYAKPFNPPQNVTAFSYIIFEADAKKQRFMRKFSLNQQKKQNPLQIKKVLQHSHKIIASLNSRTAIQIASLTKIMTCVLALQISTRYGINIKQQLVTIGFFQENPGGTSANIKKGQIYTIQQLLYGLMLPSGNDASLAIAVWGGRILLQRKYIDKEGLNLTTSTMSEFKDKLMYKKRDYYERFILQMNRKANQLNMQKTKYANSHGLSNYENKSCAFDLSILCQFAMNNSRFRQIVSCKKYQCVIQRQTQSVDKDNDVKITNNQYNWESSQNKMYQYQNSQSKENSAIASQMTELQDLQENDSCYREQNIQESTSQQTSVNTIEVVWYNTHQLLQQKSDLYIGIKTGVTNPAGPCLSSCLQINGRRFIIIVLNCKSMKHRFRDTQVLRKWLFNKQSIKYRERVNYLQQPEEQDVI